MDWPSFASKLPPTPSAVPVMATCANALATSMRTVSPGATSLALLAVAAIVWSGAACAWTVVETETSTASATAKAAATARP